MSEIPDRSRYKYNNTNTQHLQPCSLKLFRIYPVAAVVVCLAEVNDQVLLLVSEEHRYSPPSDFYSRFSRDASLYCEKCISSNSPNANSFLYALRTYVFSLCSFPSFHSNFTFPFVSFSSFFPFLPSLSRYSHFVEKDLDQMSK